MQSLWLTKERKARALRAVEEGDPTAKLVVDTAMRLADAAVDDVPFEADAIVEPDGIRPGTYTQGCAIAYLITGEAKYADQAHEAIVRWTADWTDGELKLTEQALKAAEVVDACFDAWDEAKQGVMVDLLVRLCEGQKTVEFHSGNPHQLVNNHWAVSHAGAAIAAMAAHGRRDSQGNVVDMSEQIHWARERVKMHLMLFGEQGLYHEGIGYEMYNASNWLPVLLANRNFDGLDWIAGFPNLKNMAASLFMTAATRPVISDDNRPQRGHGVKLSWNDDGLVWARNCVPVAAMHLAHDRQQPALRWMFDRLNGIHATDAFATWDSPLFLTLLYYPYDVEPTDPNGILPTHVTDNRQGLSIVRPRYADENDAILGVYARSTFAGGHSHDDAGSLRFMALGYDWIRGGGQARGNVAWQSVAFADDDRRPKPPGLGHHIWNEQTERGPIVGIDVRFASMAYHERYVAADFTGDCGRPVALALLDQIDDHKGEDWLWNMCFDRRLEAKVHDDGEGFDLIAPTGENLRARVLGARPQSIAIDKTPESQRTFQSGDTVVYHGVPFVTARFKWQKFLGIYVVMTIGEDQPPAVELIEGLDVRIGTHQWQRPFGAAIPEPFRIGQTGGLSKYPAGVVGYQV